MSDVSDAEASLTIARERASTSADAVRGGMLHCDAALLSLAEAFEDATHPDALMAVSGLTAARELLELAARSIEATDARLASYARLILGVENVPGPQALATPAVSVLLPVKTIGLTLPTRQPDLKAVPGGTPELAPRAKAPKQTALRLQKRSGEQLAQVGFDIAYLKEVPHQPSPDFSVEGRNFDCYAPQSGTGLDAIRRKLKQKIDNRQADRFVLNLDQTSHTADDVRHHLNRKAPRSLQEVIVIKDGVVAWAWPPL